MFGERVVIAHEGLKPFVENVGVNLRRGNIRVPQHLLHGAQVSTAAQEMAGEGMAQHMGRTVSEDGGVS